MAAEPFLENLALATRGSAKLQRRHADGTRERPGEVGQIGKADIVSDIGDRSILGAQALGRAPQPGPDQILVRRHADRGCEESQEMERADAGGPRRLRQIDVFVSVVVDPQGALDGTTAVTKAWAGRPFLPASDDRHETAGDHVTDFV